MNINKNVSVWRGDTTPPTIYHLWIKSNGTLFTYNGYEWVEIFNLIPLADTDSNGLMSKEDKLILNVLNLDYPIYKELTDTRIESLEKRITNIENTLTWEEYE